MTAASSTLLSRMVRAVVSAATVAALAISDGAAAEPLLGTRPLGGAPTLTTTALALVAAAVVGAAVYVALRLVPRHQTAPSPVTRGRPAVRGAVLALLALAVTLLVVTVVVYQASVQSVVANTRQLLTTFADLQVRGLAQERARLEAGALAFASSRVVTDDVATWRASNTEAGRDRLRLLLAETVRAFGFETAELWSSSGAFLLGTAGDPRRADLSELIARTATTGQMTQVPPATGSTQAAYGVLINMPVTPGQSDACCVLYLQAAPHGDMHPLLSAVFNSTHSAEALVVRPDPRGGTSVTAAVSRNPAASGARTFDADPYEFAAGPDHPDASGFGMDHQGHGVLAVRRPVPGSSTVLVVKIDKDEILDGARTSAFLSAALALVLLLLALALGRGLWQKTRLREAARELDATRALSAAEARFRAAFDQAAAGMMRLALDGTVLRANGTFCRLLGRTEEELVGARLWPLREQPAVPPEGELLRPLLEGGAAQIQAEDRYLRKDGSGVWLACTFSLVRDPEGAADEVLLVAQDVSTRHATEAALRESEERFDLAVKGSDQGVLDVNVRTGSLYLSPRARELLGIGPQDPIDVRRMWHGLLDGAGRRTLARVWSSLRRGGAPTFTCDVRLRLPDGTTHDFRCHGLAARDARGAVTRVAGMIADVTSRNQTERHLRLAAAVFASSHEGLVVTGLDGVVSAVNPAFTRITGYEPREILGSTMRVMHSGRHDREFYRRMWSALLATGGWQGEIWNRRKNGEIFLQQLTISTVCDAAGAPQNYVGAFQDITQIKHSEFQLDRIAHYDPLTDLPNRTLLTSLLDLTVSRPGKSCAVMFVDLDRFKTVNDSLGHLAGDQVLQMAAGRIKAALDGDAVLGRYGADEFVVILEELSGPDDAAATATRVIHELATPFVLADGREVYLGATAGISLYPDDADNAHRLLQHADSALVEAKSHGRGSYAFYTQALTRSARIRMEMEAELRRALVREEFRLNYQPVVDLQTGIIRGAEALVRWHSPIHGLVTPNRFIPLAEETGLIEPLGEWVLEEACRQMHEWLAKGASLDFIAVNLSPRQFQRKSLCAQIGEVLLRTGLPAERLELEITENVLFEVRASAERNLRELKEQGVRIALDDFGTGYSSLGYLKRFPITKLKIDRSFVRDLPLAADAEIATAIISIARALGLDVVAEGIETPEQADFLRSRGCHYGQGHLFSRPVTGERLLSLVMQPVPPTGSPPRGGALLH